MSRAAVIIPSFEGKALLEAHLPAALRAAERAGARLVVADDASADGTASWLAQKYPDVACVRLEKRGGYGRAVNAGVAAAEGASRVLLLNNDVTPDENALEILLKGWTDDLFALTPASLSEARGNRDEGLSRGMFDEIGFFTVAQPLLHGAATPEGRCATFHAHGGTSVFDRDKFLALGGFASLYEPFYWEDVDLCWRAWKRGWRVGYEPRARMHHRSHGTIGRFYSREEIALVWERNAHLFARANFEDKEFLDRYWRAVSCVLEAGYARPDLHRRRAGVFAAAAEQLQALAHRKKALGEERRLSDAEALARASSEEGW